jgi:hypothetical protein
LSRDRASGTDSGANQAYRGISNHALLPTPPGALTPSLSTICNAHTVFAASRTFGPIGLAYIGLPHSAASNSMDVLNQARDHGVGTGGAQVLGQGLSAGPRWSPMTSQTHQG